jgi:phosphoglycolate phosphatase-like HAD superfamily hydrolase
MQSTRSRTPGLLAFDLDGTLVTCRERHIAVCRHALDKAGIAGVDLDRFWLLKRNGRSTAKALLELGIPEDLARQVSSEWIRQVEGPEWLTLDELQPRTLEALAYVRERGREVAVVTARASSDALKGQLDKLKLLPLIQELRIVHPSRAVEEKAGALIEISPVGYIGDSEVDHEAAKEAGIRFMAVSNGQRDSEFLAERGISPICGDVLEATAALLESPGKP